MKVHIQKLDTLSRILIFCIVLIALANAYLHNPRVGYDADDYAAYIQTIAKGELPEIGINDEFFTPPLPFVLPALIKVIFNPSNTSLLKLAQYINVLVAFVSVLTLARISNRLTDANDVARNLSILFLLTLTVFFKTHAFVRAEPYLLLFVLLYVEKLIQFSNRNISPGRFSILSGIFFGAVMLSRQWGILIIPGISIYALLLLIRDQDRRKMILVSFTASGIIAFLLSAWFYLSLLNRYGSLTAFNREPSEGFSLRNKPASFYIGTGNGKLFTDPIRDSFDRQIMPILYTETWGDYWGYFLVYGKDLRTGEPVQGGLLQLALQEDDWRASINTNRFEINRYLGRVNLVSALPSAIAVVSFALSLASILSSYQKKVQTSETMQMTLFVLIILSTLVGYLWFLVQYPTADGDTIKATYIIQIFPFIALLVGLYGRRLVNKWGWSYWLLVGIFLLTLLHNGRALITRTLV